MNIFSTFSPFNSGSPAAWLGSGAQAQRLGVNSPLQSRFNEAYQFQAQSMLQLSMQMLKVLTSLMMALPGRAESLPLPGQVSPTSKPGAVSASQDGASKGERIRGGKSLYKNGMFHKGAKDAPNTYAFENSPAGIKFAAQRGYSSIDLDMQITKDGVPVATHWSKPLEKDGFYDPLGKIGPKTKVKDMTLAEVMRLRNKDGQSRIYPMSTMIQLLKQHGIAGDLEAKDDPRFATDKMMGYIADLVRQSGIRANLKSIDRGDRSDKILKKAQEHGFWVRTASAGGKKARYIGYGE